MKGLNKTLNGLKASESLEKRLVYESIVQWQPQFLHQKPYVPYFYSKFAKRERGDTFEDYIRFVVTATDRLMFPELKTKKQIKLRVSQCGKILEV